MLSRSKMVVGLCRKWLTSHCFAAFQNHPNTPTHTRVCEKQFSTLFIHHICPVDMYQRGQYYCRKLDANQEERERENCSQYTTTTAVLTDASPTHPPQRQQQQQHHHLAPPTTLPAPPRPRDLTPLGFSCSAPAGHRSPLVPARSEAPLDRPCQVELPPPRSDPLFCSKPPPPLLLVLSP